MAIQVQTYAVVVRKSTLQAKFPGGVESFEACVPNSTCCMDKHLCSAQFMLLSEADQFTAVLAAKGLTPTRGGECEDVAIVCADSGFIRPCSWLNFDQQNIASVYLQGQEAGELAAPACGGGNTLFFSHEEARERLELIGEEANVLTYRDRTTGQIYYQGRAAPKPDIERHNRLYKEATAMIGDILFGSDTPSTLSPDEVQQAMLKSSELLGEVVSICPDNWAAMWVNGKIHQRLDQHTDAVRWFARAYRVNPDHADVAREAAISAMESGQLTEATFYCDRALEIAPDDPGLICNLALAQLFSQQPGMAQATVARSLALDPQDSITRRLQTVITQVLENKRPCPRTMRDITS